MPKTKTEGEAKPSKMALMIHSEKMTVERVVMLDNNTAEVHARGPRRSPREITVHFDRRGNIAYGNLHVPEYLINEKDGCYIPPECIPEPVRDAAAQMHRQRR